MTLKTYYHILNVSPRATDDDVRRAWRALALRWHPDRAQINKAQAQKTFVLINHAYMMLKTKPQREAYNRQLLKARPVSNDKKVSQKKQARKTSLLSNIAEIFWPFSLNTESELRHG